MLSADLDRYIALRRALGYKLTKTEAQLRPFARHVDECGDSHIRAPVALAWATAAGRTPAARGKRLRVIIKFARFLRAEDARHEVPPADICSIPSVRPAPYIYTTNEIADLLDAAGAVRRQHDPVRRDLYVTLFGLIAAAGLRVSEALALRLDDVRPEGVLHIRETKFGKSRLVPLHPTVVDALGRYLAKRKHVAGSCDWLFPSVGSQKLSPRTVNYMFHASLRRANIAPGRARRPRIHDLRHTFATRALEQCGASRGEVARHFVALSTYLGHADIRHTYWYLQATSEMMTDIATAAEMLVGSAAA